MRSATDALESLKAGNARFVSDAPTAELRDAAHRQTLTEGQAPWAIVLSCADSRVVPELAFDTGIGEIFVVRVAGSIANTSTIATIEYAVEHLGVPLVVVLGHEGCGAVAAALAGGDCGHNLNHLLVHILPAVLSSDDKELGTVVKRNAALTAEALRSRSDIMRAKVESGDLQIVPGYYELGSGKVTF